MYLHLVVFLGKYGVYIPYMGSNGYVIVSQIYGLLLSENVSKKRHALDFGFIPGVSLSPENGPRGPPRAVNHGLAAFHPEFWRTRIGLAIGLTSDEGNPPT